MRQAYDGDEEAYEFFLGFDALTLAAGVTIVGQKGVEFAILDPGACGNDAELLGCEGARIESVLFTQGLEIASGSVTIEKCPVMEDCHVFGSGVSGVDCGGKVTVAAAEHTEELGREQTVSSGNGGHDWATAGTGGIEGLAEGIQVRAP